MDFPRVLKNTQNSPGTPSPPPPPTALTGTPSGLCACAPGGGPVTAAAERGSPGPPACSGLGCRENTGEGERSAVRKPDRRVPSGNGSPHSGGRLPLVLDNPHVLRPHPQGRTDLPAPRLVQNVLRHSLHNVVHAQPCERVLAFASHFLNKAGQLGAERGRGENQQQEVSAFYCWEVLRGETKMLCAISTQQLKETNTHKKINLQTTVVTCI